MIDVVLWVEGSCVLWLFCVVFLLIISCVKCSFVTIETLDQAEIHYFSKLTTKSGRIHNNTLMVTSGV